MLVLNNRQDVVFYQDNSSHTVCITFQKLEELGWEKLVHSLCSPDLAPSDYHLFRSLQNFLDGKYVYSRKDVQNAISIFLDSIKGNFFNKGFENYLKNGNYIEDSVLISLIKKIGRNLCYNLIV